MSLAAPYLPIPIVPEVATPASTGSSPMAEPTQKVRRKRHLPKRRAIAQQPVHPLAAEFVRYVVALNHRWQYRAEFATAQFCRWLHQNVPVFSSQSPHALTLAVIEPHHLSEYVQYMAMTYPNRNTRRVLIMAVRRWMHYLHDHNHLPRDLSASLPSVARQPALLDRSLDPEQVRAFFSSIHVIGDEPLRDTALFGCLAALGLRPGEALRLRIGDLDRSGALVRILGKGNRERLVPLNGTVLLAIEQYLVARSPSADPGTHLWEDSVGAPLTYSRLLRVFHRYRRHAGISTQVGGPHVFRHYFITQSLLSGADLRDVAAMVGHSSIRPLEAYFHVSPAQMKTVLTGERPGGAPS